MLMRQPVALTENSSPRPLCETDSEMSLFILFFVCAKIRRTSDTSKLYNGIFIRFATEFCGLSAFCRKSWGVSQQVEEENDGFLVLHGNMLYLCIRNKNKALFIPIKVSSFFISIKLVLVLVID